MHYGGVSWSFVGGAPSAPLWPKEPPRSGKEVRVIFFAISGQKVSSLTSLGETCARPGGRYREEVGSGISSSRTSDGEKIAESDINAGWLCFPCVAHTRSIPQGRKCGFRELRAAKRPWNPWHSLVFCVFHFS